MARSILLAAFAAAAAGCASSPFRPVDEARYVDLSHAFNDATIHWPTARGFQFERVAYGPSAAGYWYAAANFCTAEHCGTHMDAPIHFAEGHDTVDRVPLARCFGPIDLVDVRERCRVDSDYRIQVEDLEYWEGLHGKIQPGDIVIFRTGFEERWPDPRRYLGSDLPGDASHLHFPGLGEAAARFLVTRRVDAIGIDTASMDYGPSSDFVVHRVLSEADVPGLENLSNLAELPPRGAYLVALPMKIEGGTGGPCRMVALLR
jgi:kynurenine formamidase